MPLCDGKPEIETAFLFDAHSNIHQNLKLLIIKMNISYLLVCADRNRV